MSESESAVAIIENVDRSLLPSSVQPMVEEVKVLIPIVNSIRKADMVEYKESVIQEITDEGDKKLCEETISEIEREIKESAESIRDRIIALINELRRQKGRVEELGGGKRRKKKGGEITDADAENIIGAIPVFILFYIIFLVFGAIGAAINSIGKGVSKFLPETEQIQGPPGRRIDRTVAIGPAGRYGGKKSRRQRRKRTVKRR